MNSYKIKNRRSINQNSIEVAHDATLEQRFISCSQDHTKLKILGISAYYHDSAASLIVNGEIIAAAEEERFSRIKHDHSFPL
ncbi:MAG: carbamoyltransferase N-terminal domain-containing protein, partial [Crocinitomicaceae bacterium]|nr:carbamoyltransferase N-terminal domain-containing protein [Crocinitomicaceae bacterium]